MFINEHIKIAVKLQRRLSHHKEHIHDDKEEGVLCILKQQDGLLHLFGVCQCARVIGGGSSSGGVIIEANTAILVNHAHIVEPGQCNTVHY